MAKKSLTEEQKKARRLAVKNYVARNPGFASAKKKRYKKRNPAKVKAKRLEQRYGLSIEQHQAMFKTQNDKCAICSRHKDTNPLGLHVDHCHATGKVRGLLCPSCNQALGLLQDNPAVCEKAAHYLRSNNGQS